MTSENGNLTAIVDITNPLNNSLVRNAQIPVSGTAVVDTLSLVVRMYRGSSQDAIETQVATFLGTNWSTIMRGPFPLGAYRIVASQAIDVTVNVTVRVTPVAITSPSGEVPSKQITIKGTGGEPGLGTVTVYNSSNVRLGDATINPNGNWEFPYTMPGETLTFYAQQKIGNYTSPPSNQLTVSLKADNVVIVSPTTGETIRELKPLVSGRGQNDADITIYKAGDSSSVYGSTKVSNGQWSTRLIRNLPLGAFTFHASQIYQGNKTWSNQVPVNVKLKTPVITEPLENSLQDRSFTISGTDGEAPATMSAYLDLVGTEIGGPQPVTDDTWEVAITIPSHIPPGKVAVVAMQILNGHASEKSDDRAFIIRPPKITDLKAKVDDNAGVTISGADGYPGATLDLHHDTEQPPVHSFPVTESSWSKSFSDWPPGPYRIYARQSVDDGLGGKIYSDWTPVVDFNVHVPRSTLAVKVNPQGLPEFSGKGRTWSEKPTTIRIYINGSSHPDVSDGSVTQQGDWQIIAQKAFAPGEYSVTAEQRYNGLASEQTEPQKLVIERPRPAPPEIDPVNDEGRFPTISGKGISGAMLKLVYSDATTEHSIEIRNGRWSFQRTDKALAPGRRSVTARQEVDGLVSDPDTEAFVIATPQPRITLPKQDDQVGANTDVEGTEAVAGATMEIYDYITEELLNTALIDAEDEVKGWQVTLRNLPFGRRHIFAVQTYEGQPSKPSDFRSFNVILLPPGITYPKSNDDVPRSSIHRGTGTPFALIELRLKGAAPDEQVEYVYADEYGEWQKELKLPLGPCTVRARQSIDDQESEFSEPVPFIVVPDEPRLETPTNLEPVESLCVVSGFADSPGTVTLALVKESPPLETVAVNDNGTWSLRVHLEDIPAGEHSLIARLSQQGFDSHWSPPRSFVLRKNPPAMDMPHQGDWANNRVAFAGKANPKAIIEMHPWFNPDIGLTPERVSADTSGNWNTEAEKDLAQGPNWATARQRTVDEGGQEQVSEAAISGRIEVVLDDSESMADGVND